MNKACEHIEHCACGKNCTEELAAKCSIIHPDIPTPSRPWIAEESVAVTLTREDWRIICVLLEHSAISNEERARRWREDCGNLEYGERTAAGYDRSSTWARKAWAAIVEQAIAECETFVI